MSEKKAKPDDVADANDRVNASAEEMEAYADELDMDADLRDDDLHDDASGDEASSAVDQLQAEVERLQAEKQAAYEKMARVQAEYQNSRRRLDQEFAQRLQLASADLVRSILPVIDNFERGLAVDPNTASPQSILDGLQGVHDQMLDVLKKQGVERLSPEPGMPFDPNQMEALMQQQSDFEPNHVTQVFSPGYTIGGRMLRPAQVAVSR